MDKGCKRHPSHKQSKGVCPSCLRERLSHLSAASSSAATNPSNSSTNSSPFSSDTNLSSIATDSPPRTKSLTLVLNCKPLKKSRSLAFVVEEEEEGEKEKKKKKGRFWSKLMGSRKEDSGFLHSMTVKEKSSAKWVLFT